MAALPQEVLCIDPHDASLVGLRDIRENTVHHRDKHSVLQRMPRVFDNRDDVRSALRHVDEISSGTMAELNGVDAARRPHDVRDVRYSCPSGSACVVSQ